MAQVRIWRSDKGRAQEISFGIAYPHFMVRLVHLHVQLSVFSVICASLWRLVTKQGGLQVLIAESFAVTDFAHATLMFQCVHLTRNCSQATCPACSGN